jgi:RNAse (barnase) inhibitor barstar
MNKSTKIVNRADITDADFVQMLETETHHDHEIVMGRYDVLKWKENTIVVESLDKINLNDLIQLLYSLGYDKNSEVFRKLYRDMGYSLDGYWEIFYWEVNNPITHEYKNKVRKYKIAGVILD